VRIQHQPGVGRALVTLAWSQTGIRQRRFHPSDRAQNVTGLASAGLASARLASARVASTGLGHGAPPLSCRIAARPWSARQGPNVALADPFGVSDHLDTDDLPVRDGETLCRVTRRLAAGCLLEPGFPRGRKAGPARLVERRR